VVYALSVSYKIYPIIYVPTIWASLAGRHGWWGWGVWRFGLVTLGTLLGVNGALWSIWGQPFLEHTFLYHLHRLDHRHNFSPYFYPIYLSLFTPSSTSGSASLLSLAQTILRHPLTSFLPQFTLVLLAGFMLTPKLGLAFTMFVQTASFVVFNKVCTSQYFMWFLPLLPPIIPHLHLTPLKSVILVLVWVLAQALWLGMAYRLEFLGAGVYLSVWGAGLGLFGVSVWVLGEMMDGFRILRGRDKVD